MYIKTYKQKKDLRAGTAPNHARLLQLEGALYQNNSAEDNDLYFTCVQFSGAVLIPYSYWISELCDRSTSVTIQFKPFIITFIEWFDYFMYKCDY